MKKLAVAVALAALVLAGCGDDSSDPSDADASETPTSQSPSATPTETVEPIVGEWQRVTTCEQRVKALRQAGLESFAAEQAAGDGWIPGVTDKRQLKDPSHPCAGAVPLKHSHFFTADGEFGSRDDAGMQVDDGPYRLVGDDKLVIGGGDEGAGADAVTFRYEIKGDSLRLYPKLPACAKKGCFAGQWAVAVSYNGLPWRRIS